MVLDPRISLLPIEEGRLLSNHNVLRDQAFIQLLGMPEHSLLMQMSSSR